MTVRRQVFQGFVHRIAVLGVAALAAVAAAGPGAGHAVAGSAPGAPSAGVPAAGAASGEPSVTPLAVRPVVDTVPSVTVRPDPSYVGEPFEGWGTSLVWFANATGGYPDEIRNRLVELVFGPSGLNLNIARYNIGGGNAPDVPNYLRPGGAVQGWWKAPVGTTRADKEWWDPANPEHWNLTADATQRWWVDAIKGRVTRWETFSNSPPWFQTVSGYVSGGFDSSADQIRADRADAFAAYLVRVTAELEKAHGIKVATLNPLNEPNTPYWGTRLGANGDPTGGRQEGAHAGPALQQTVLRAVAARLAASGSATTVSAMDETNPGTFLTNWNAYADDVRTAVSRLNVHTYGTGQRTGVRDVAKGEGKPLWMSEVEGSWGTGQSFTDMAPGLGMAQRIVEDLRELEPSAWVLWQPVEDYDNMKPGGESAAGMNWGSIQLPFNCTAKDTLATCPIRTNTKFDTVRNFTHYVRPGDRLLKTGDTASVAAVSPKNGLTVVHVNETAAARSVVLDLSAFGSVAAGATVTPVVSSAAGALVSGAPVKVSGRTATVRVPAQSVTTFVVKGAVSGVAASAPVVQAGHVYRLQGVASGRSLTPTADRSGLVLRTDAMTADQLWTLRPLGAASDSRGRYTITTGSGDRRLATSSTGALTTVPVGAATAVPAAAQWILSTTGDGRWTVVNVGTRRVLDVNGQGTADGTAVGMWFANSGGNQLWRLVDETVLSIPVLAAWTRPGTVPVLPATVVPVHRDGARGSLPVTWTMPKPSTWKKPGTVTVQGTATDVLGRSHKVTAKVVVDTLVGALPARAKTYVGGTPALPATVDTRASRGATVPGRGVVWDAVPAASLARAGVVTVTGRADAGAGTTVRAVLRLQVTEPGEENAALTAGTTASATYTEPGYSASGLVDGVLTDKAWSNWRPGTLNAADTLTVTLPAARDLTRVVTTFYRDGRDSYARTMRLETRTATGDWVAVGDPVTVPTGSPAPSVALPVPASVPATAAVRVVLDAYPAGHMTVSEVQVFAKVPGRSATSTAASIRIDGRPLLPFSPTRTEYQIRAGRRLPVVAATATDPYAKVSVTQPTSRKRTATVSVTSEDGSRTTTYTIRLRIW